MIVISFFYGLSCCSRCAVAITAVAGLNLVQVKAEVKKGAGKLKCAVCSAQWERSGAEQVKTES